MMLGNRLFQFVTYFPTIQIFLARFIFININGWNMYVLFKALSHLYQVHDSKAFNSLSCLIFIYAIYRSPSSTHLILARHSCYSVNLIKCCPCFLSRTKISCLISTKVCFNYVPHFLKKKCNVTGHSFG
jgi:hypothetical protein